MRLLHTGDWHLGRTIRGQSRQPEFEAALECVVDIALRERVDAVAIAGDTFDAFSPPAEAEKLLYHTLERLLRDGVRVVMIAGNHDHAPRMEAIAGVLRIAGAECIGAVPKDAGYAPLVVPSRDGSEAVAFVALPWVPERMAVEFEQLFGTLGEVLHTYAGRMEEAIRFFCQHLPADMPGVLLGHMLIDGAVIGEDGGERKLHIGQNFAVPSSALPATASYVALGHVHRPQRIASGAPAHYAGSLLQLDFGEAGQDKSVNLVELRKGQPAQVERVPVTGGRALRNVRLAFDDLASHGGRYGDDYLRVYVELERPAASLYERVRAVLPNALEVTPVLPQSAGPAPPVGGHRAIAPDELFGRYYARENGGASIPADLLAMFRELHQAEVERAPA